LFTGKLLAGCIGIHIRGRGMNIFLALAVIGIVLIGRAAFVALKIKKDPETKKYGNNPKKAIVILAIIGAVLFLIGSIGLS
jgi:heme/copper-type cytochrome/quinol oxidase subunit 2